MLPPSRAPRQPGIGRMRQARRGFAAIAAVAVGEEAGRAEEAPSGVPAVSPVRAVRPGAARGASRGVSRQIEAPPRGHPADRAGRCPDPWKTCLSFVHPLEQASVGTHVVGFLAFAALLVVRAVLAVNAAAPRSVDPFTLVQIGSIAVAAAAFGASAAYHASSKSVVASAYLLALDRSFVYASIVSSGTADLVVATMGSATPLTACALAAPRLPDPSVPWQTYLDPLLAGAIAIVCVVAVRVTRWPSDTSGQNGYNHPSGLDSRRPGHVAGSFGVVYAVMAGACALAWICSADYELRMFPEGVGATVIAVKAVSTAVAVLLWTNELRETTDAYAVHFPIALRKYLPRSHTLWHVAALVAAACAIGVREWALSAQFEASAACADRLGRGSGNASLVGAR